MSWFTHLTGWALEQVAPEATDAAKKAGVFQKGLDMYQGMAINTAITGAAVIGAAATGGAALAVIPKVVSASINANNAVITRTAVDNNMQLKVDGQVVYDPVQDSYALDRGAQRNSSSTGNTTIIIVVIAFVLLLLTKSR